MRNVSYRLLALAAGLALASAPRVASAAEVNDDAAAALEHSLHDWLAGLLGPSAKLGEQPVHVTAVADHFSFEIPLTGAIGGTGVTVTGGAWTVAARPLDGDRWAIDSMKMPSPMTVVAPVPNGSGTAETTVTVDSQDVRGVLDPSLATATSIDSSFTGYQSSMKGPENQSTRMERMTSHLSLLPSGPGQVVLQGESEIGHTVTSGTAQGVGQISFSAAKIRATLHVDGLAPAQAAPIIHAIADLIPMAMTKIHEATEQAKAAQSNTDGAPAPSAAKPVTDPAMKNAARAALRRAVVAIPEVAKDFDEQYTVEDMQLQSAGFSGHIGTFKSGMALSAPGGLLRMRLNFTIDGIESPSIPPGPLREFVPRHIAFTPKFSGVPSQKLMALVLRAIDSDGDDPGLEKQATALVFGGAVAGGLDDLALDVGPATLKGSGEMHVLGMNNFTGEAHLVATGFDDLIQRANTTPELQEAAPVLIFMKGVSKQDGDRTIWNVSYAGKKLLVNGNDMSAMMPGK